MGSVERRTLLSGGSAALFAGLVSARAAPATEALPLPIPPLVDARRAGQLIALSAAAGVTTFFPGSPSRTAGFNGGYLGPTLRVHSGDDVAIAVTNRLAEATTVHWHGLLVPAQVDGGPHHVIAPGASWRPVLPIRQPATTAWYHAHLHPRTGPQVYSGLAGMMIVADDAERVLGLPSDYGVNDLPLILQDRAFDRDGRLTYPLTPMSVMQGVRGDVVLVNGAVGPTASVPRGRVRLRLLNASNARIFDLAFDDGRAFEWIGVEGGLLAAPVPMRRLRLAPAQRAEILVDFSDGSCTGLVTGPDRNFPMMGGMGRGGMGMTRRGGGGAARILSFAPQGPPQASAPTPRRLAVWSRPAIPHAVRRRSLQLTMGMMGGMMMGRGGMGRGGMGRGMDGGHGIDGRAFDMGRIDQRVRLGDVEIWNVSGDMMHHPFHMHGVHFEVLSRNGGPPELGDQGRRDTVLVQEPVELLVHFTQPAVDKPFMYHCHILEHEDHGMMGQYTVV